MLVFALSASLLPMTHQVSADDAAIAKPAQLPATVSDDPLPTVQTNGVVWDSVTVGNRVFVTGNFSSARPAGSPAGQNETSRGNLLAFDINTGALDQSFNHSLNAEGKAITASPDGKRLYVGGKFTQVDGQNRYRIAAFDLTTNQMVSQFNQGAPSTIGALAATNTRVYAGGDFTATIRGINHTRLMAFDSGGQVIDNWTPSTNAIVTALVMSSDNQRLILGGNFSQLNGQKYHALGAVDANSGAALPWASQSDSFPIRVDVPASAITSLSTDGQQVYLTAYNFHAKNDPGGFEGRAAINQRTGDLIWMTDCHGDSYDSVPLNNVLYSVGHAHDCQAAQAFPETSPRSYYRALAETTYATGNNVAGTQGYWNFNGQPRASQLAWYPVFTTGATDQAGWATTGNSDYLVIAGDFPTVDGIAQQNIVRFAIKSKAPNKSGPRYYPAGTSIKVDKVGADGTSAVSWPTTWDRDDAVLNYTLYRDGVQVATRDKGSKFWALATMRFIDKGLQPGSTHTYRVVVRDPAGNKEYLTQLPATGCHVTQGNINTLCPGEVLTNGQAIFSQNGKYTLRMQSDGDLRLINLAGTQLWHSNTAGREYSKFTLQTDGNAVVYPTRGGYSWNSGTNGRNAAYLTLRNDGNIVIYNTSNQQIWASNSAQAN